jgi:hypothetical protein
VDAGDEHGRDRRRRALGKRAISLSTEIQDRAIMMNPRPRLAALALAAAPRALIGWSNKPRLSPPR